MRDPWAEFAPSPPSSAPPISGVPEVIVPRQPPPARPEEVTGTNLRNVRTEQEIRQGEYTTAAQPRRDQYTDESGLRREFIQRPEVRSYQEVLPQYVSARNAADTRAGDLNLIYAFGKIMDPGSVVREGEMVMAQGTGTVQDRLGGLLGELDGRGRLRPETRAALMTELRTRRIQLAQSYAQSRDQYITMAREYGFDPRNIVGEHPAEPFAEQERASAAAIASEPGVGGVPLAHNLPHEQEVPPGGEEFQRDLQAVVTSGQLPDGRPLRTAEDLIAFGRTRGFNIDAAQAEATIRARARGQVAAVRTPTFEVDISDMRGDGGAGETVDAFGRQASNSVTAGLSDVVSAGIDAATTDRTFSESLRREHRIDDYDFREHPVASIAGAVAGGVLLPTGAVNSSRTAALAAIRAGEGRAAALAAARSAGARRLAGESAVYGGFRGAADTDGDLSDRIANTAIESALGAGTGNLLGRIGRYGGRRSPRAGMRPPLVDPATGRLNSPLEAASSAERVGAANAYGIDLPLGAAGGRTAAILEKGLDIMPGSAGVMQDARAELGRDVATGVEAVAARYGSSPDLHEAGRQLQRGARGWIERAQGARGVPEDRGVVGRAYDRIPIAAERPAVADNTRTALGEMVDVFRSNPRLREIFQNQRLQRYLDALTPPHDPADELGAADPIAGVMRTVGRATEQQPGQISWQDLKHFRSIIGEEIGEARFSDSPLKSQLRRLYGALSEDMRSTASAHGPRALRAFERANNLNRQVEERIDNALVSILGDDNRNNPEAAARLIQTISRGGRGTSNLDQLAEIRGSLGKGREWNEVASTLVRLMGQPVNSQGREFNPQTFVQNYADMSEPARDLLFGDRGRRGLRQALDGFVEVSQRLAGTNALRNTSNTAPGITAAGTVSTLGASLLNPMLGLKLAAVGAANYGMARLWTNPAFVRWYTGYERARGGLSGRDALRALEGRRQALSRLAVEEPTIASEIAGIDQALFGDENER